VGGLRGAGEVTASGESALGIAARGNAALGIAALGIAALGIAALGNAAWGWAFGVARDLVLPGDSGFLVIMDLAMACNRDATGGAG
jgi:hypothetical protein